LNIGAQAGVNYFQGVLDDIRIYSRALTAEEIAQLAQPSPVGGMAELPEVAGSSGPNHIALAGAAALLALAAGGWYARRRWLG
jgi:hypothetical protein